MKVFTVGTFVEDDKQGVDCKKSHVQCYTLWYSAEWKGCIEYEVETTSGKEAKRLATLMRLEHEHGGDPFDVWPRLGCRTRQVYEPSTIEEVEAIRVRRTMKRLHDRLVLTLRMPPSVNNYYATIMLGKGKNAKPRRIVSADGKAFQQHVYDYVLEHNVPRCSGRLDVEIFLFFNTRAGDVDNRTKPMLDALQKSGVFENDRCVDRVTAQRVASRYPVKPGLALIRITKAKASWTEDVKLRTLQLLEEQVE